VELGVHFLTMSPESEWTLLLSRGAWFCLPSRLSYNPGNMTCGFLDSSLLRSFRNDLLGWFEREKRNLPWRGEADPYRILVSEIMLQQTRVAVVKQRYTMFVERFPNVTRLARAREESVLAAWSGLGYYRRARALHAAVKHIQKKRVFPGSAAELAKLPGIGRYTAAAVASIAFGEPIALVDGNVKRVLQRLTGKDLSTDANWRTAQELLEKREPGNFNQALMELGAVVCIPGQPLCHRCPVARFCSWPLSPRNTVSAKTPERRRKATLSYILVQKNGSVFLRQRPTSLSLMPGMWELPQANVPRNGNPVLRLRHSITNTDYTVHVFTAAHRKSCPGSWVEIGKVNRLPLTGLARKILRRLDLLP
jgi:A/G-specific adenine glycosylase